jgi:hypothetical protein
VIHWIDCAEAGEPVDNQCAPGEWTPATSSTVVVISTSTVKPTIKVAGKTRLPTDHGMFVPMATYQSKTSERPQDSQAPRNIAIVSIVFTVATSLAFLVAVGCLCRDKCCNSTCVKKMIHRAKEGPPILIHTRLKYNSIIIDVYNVRVLYKGDLSLYARHTCTLITVYMGEVSIFIYSCKHL